MENSNDLKYTKDGLPFSITKKNNINENIRKNIVSPIKPQYVIKNHDDNVMKTTNRIIKSEEIENHNHKMGHNKIGNDVQLCIYDNTTGSVNNKSLHTNLVIDLSNDTVDQYETNDTCNTNGTNNQITDSNKYPEQPLGMSNINYCWIKADHDVKNGTGNEYICENVDELLLEETINEKMVDQPLKK